jgi:two-component system sensor histidine kinase/response regulator
MSTMHGADEVFDQGRFLANVDGNLELMREVAQLFLEDCPRRLAALQDAMLRRDRRALEHTAHTLKGSAGYLSAPGVFTAADEVETIARCGDLADANHACAKLQQETRQLAQVLASLR